MISVSCFKLIEFQLFSIFGIFNNNLVWDSSILLSLERTIWIIIETIIDNFEVNKKKLVLVQIIVSSLGALLPILVCFCIFCDYLCNIKDNKNSTSNEVNNVVIY